MMVQKTEVTLDNFEKIYWQFVDLNIAMGEHFMIFPDDFIKSIKNGMTYKNDILYTRIKEIKFSNELDEHLDKEIKRRLFK